MHNRLKELRTINKLSLRKLRDELLKKENLSLSRDILNKYELEKVNPKLKTWEKLADFYGVTVPYLQGYSDIKEDINKSFTFTIPGNPKGKERPRASRNGHFYTPKATHDYEDLVRYNAKFEYAKVSEDARPLECPVRVDILATYKVPKSYSKKRKEACLSGAELPTKKPDSDNIVKAILDGMNPKKKRKFTIVEGIYKDDSQVTTCLIKKRYGTTPGVKVEVSWHG